MGPIDEERQQRQFEQDDRRGEQHGRGLQQTMARPQALVRGDDVLEFDGRLAERQPIAMGEADFRRNGPVVEPDGPVGTQTGHVDARAALLEPGMARREIGIVGQRQVAFGVVADQGERLADDEPLALVASGLNDQPIHAGASVRDGLGNGNSELARRRREAILRGGAESGCLARAAEIGCWVENG